MINERYVKKSPNISSFYSWSDAKIYDVQTSSHRYLWQGLACLWSPLKVFQQKPVLFGSLGTNMLQYIIQESLQATWNAESGLFEGGRGALEYRTGFFFFVFFSAAYLLREKFSCLSFFSSTWLHWLIRFHVESECLCTVSTFLQQRDGYSSLQHITLLRWKRFLIQTALFAEEKCLHVSDVYSGQLMFIWFNYLKTSCPGFIVSESVLLLTLIETFPMK